MSSYNKNPSKPVFTKNLLRFFVASKPNVNQCDYLAGKTFAHNDGENKAVGILPLVIQSVENCYSHGFESISFGKNNDGKPEMIYCESDREYVIPLGFDAPEVFNLQYRNDNFLIASSAKFAKNEDDEGVFVIRLDFLETPSSRIIKIYWIDENNIRMEQSETPGEDFMMRLSDMMISEYSEKPIIGTVLDKFGVDYIGYKIGKIFNPCLTLTQIT